MTKDNEQIKKLYLQSLDDKQSFCYQRFANLIIQDCIDQLQTNQLCDPYTGNLTESYYNDALIDCIDVIKEHFEVGND